MFNMIVVGAKLNMSVEKLQNQEKRVTSVVHLGPFDKTYYEKIKEYDWNALDHPEWYSNVRYFTAYIESGTPVGVIGVYDTGEDKNIIDVQVEQQFRGQGLAQQMEEQLMEQLHLTFITITVDLENEPSLRAAEKLPGVKRVSLPEEESRFNKVKFVYSRKEY